MNFQEEYERSLDRSNKEMITIFEEIRQALRGKSKAEIMEALAEQDTPTLRWICQQVALPTEDYEICAAAKAILQAREESL
jgi:hypothetical protein